MKISARILLAFLLICLVPLIAITIYVNAVASRSITHHVLSHLESVASVQHARTHSIIEEYLERLVLVISRTQLRISMDNYIREGNSTDRDKMNKILLETRDAITDLKNIDVLSLDGEVVASTNEDQIGMDLAYEEYFIRGLAGNNVGTLFLDENHGLMSYFSGPMYLEEELMGVVVAEASTSSLISVVSDYTGLGETGETLIAKRDAKGDALFIAPLRFDTDAALTRTASKEALELPITQALLGNEQLFTESVDYRGEQVLAATRYIEDTDWGLVVKIDKAEALESIIALRNSLLLAILVIVVAIVIVSIYVSRKITQPIVVLTHTAAEITKGDLSRRVEITSKDEIGILAQSFNQMTESLADVNIGLEQKVKERTSELEKEIIERKQVERNLLESEERYRAVFNEAQDGIVLIDDETGQIIDCNAEFERQSGRDLEQLKKKSIWQLRPPEKIELAKKTFHKTREKGAGGSADLELQKPDGNITYIDFITSRISIRGKQYLQSMSRDITERRQAEEREKLLQQELNISSRLASVGEMAAGIAHEINNPLTAVVGFTESLLKNDLSENVRKDINIVYEGAQRIADVTSRMLTFARQDKPKRATVNVNDIIKTTLGMRSYAMKSNNIKVDTQLDPDLPTTIADAGQLQQVFLNVVLNAETEMITAHRGGNLMVKTKMIDDTIRISVKDDGPGIRRKNLEKIFDPFFTTREVGKGTGLGLSVSYGIIKQHDGKIYAKSTLGKGTTFFVELPIVTKAEQLKLVEPAEVAPESMSKARILVVDDEPLVQDFLTTLLSEKGHEVKIIDSCNDALERLDNEDYDIIMLDVKLPGMSGIELYNQLQKKDKYLVRRVIFITGDVMEEDTMSFLSRTKAPYITKPFDIDKMMVEIGRKLSQK